jgi:hypothetical protein
MTQQSDWGRERSAFAFTHSRRSERDEARGGSGSDGEHCVLLIWGCLTSNATCGMRRTDGISEQVERE